MTSASTNHRPTRVVASNSFWYGVDSLLGIVLLFATSIPIANVIGPERLGYFNFIMWLTTMSGVVGSLGVPGAAGKFMAEHIGKEQPGIVHGIFLAALRVQIVCATVITMAGLGVLFVFGSAEHRFVSSLQILSVLPMMIGQIATQANLANERMRDNVPSSVVSNVVFAIIVLTSLAVGWDLVGIAAGMLVSRTLELAMRMSTTLRWMRRLPLEPLGSDLTSRMRTFAFQQTYILLLSLLVWNKSDIIFLKVLSDDIRQVTFFTLAFNLIDRTVLLPQVLASAMSVSMLVQQGRGESHVPRMAADAGRYMFLFSAPLLFGMFLISGPLIRVLYNTQYLAVIPVLAIAALLGIVKPLVEPIDAVFRATGRQGRMLFWSTGCGVINLVADWLLIPGLGAIGAAIANGMAQTLLVVGYWAIGAVWFGVKLDWVSFMKIGASAVAMCLPIVLINRTLPPYAALPAGVASGAVVFLLMLRITRTLNQSDAARFANVAGMAPRQLQPAVHGVLQFLIPRYPDRAVAGQA